MEYYDILVVGAGAAGISAAKAAKGARVLLADRGSAPGGVLLQCAHRGFGAGLDGVEYAHSLSRDISPDTELALNTTVLEIRKDKSALLSGKSMGRREIGFSRLVLASGCREKTAAELNIFGTRPAGVYTAGQMQKMMNVYSHVPEGPAVILGSGDLGLIMAEQLAEKGIRVTLVEREASCGGMARNRRRIENYPVELVLSATVTELFGENRLESLALSDGRRIPCATLLLAAGLVPERSLIQGFEREEWLKLCGNCRSVHPMIESVIKEGIQAGSWACRDLRDMYG